MSKKGIKRLLAVLIVLLLAAVAGVWYTVSQRTEETVITGWPSTLECGPDDEAEIKISVDPLKGRMIELQRYDRESGKWEEAGTFRNGKIRIDKKYRDRMTSVWRVHVPEADRATEAVSNSMVLTCKNIEEPDLAAKSAVIYRVDGDGKGTFLYEMKPHEQLAQASTTKLMTAILLIESGKLEDSTVISEKAASTHEIYHELKEGDEYNNHDLMYALMLESANDAATALAEGVSGDTATFVDLMNRRAQELGLTETNYKNPHGLDQNGHYSTAVDVAKLTAFAYTFPDIRESWTYKTKEITSLRQGRTWELESTDKILGYNDHFKGGKTGTQPVAGRCFAGVYEYGGETYVTVVLGCKTEKQRWADTKALHRYIEKYSG